jgi:hypothetical protein
MCNFRYQDINVCWDCEYFEIERIPSPENDDIYDVPKCLKHIHVDLEDCKTSFPVCDDYKEVNI